MRPRWALALRLCARVSSGALVVDVGSFPRTLWVHTLLQPVQPVSNTANASPLPESVL